MSHKKIPLVQLRDLMSVTLDQTGKKLKAVFIDQDLQTTTRVYSNIEDVAKDSIDFAKGVIPAPQAPPAYYKSEELKFTSDAVSSLEGVRIQEGQAYYSDIPISVAPGVLNEAIRAHNAQDHDRLNAVWKFWARLANNPDAQARADLMRFILVNDMTITSSGFFIAYRNAVLSSKGNESDQYQRILTIQKEYMNAIMTGKDPSKIHLIDEVMSLQRLYETMYETYGELTLTDSYSKSTTIRPGVCPVRMPRELCDSDPHTSCSSGLHVASASWLSSGYFGNETLLCIVDPSKVVAVPYDYQHGKMRVCEYFPVGIIERDANGKIPQYPVNTVAIKYDAELEYKYGNTTLDAATIVDPVQYDIRMWDAVSKDLEAIASRVESYKEEAKNNTSYLFDDDDYDEYAEDDYDDDYDEDYDDED